jgi:hypothetical protein
LDSPSLKTLYDTEKVTAALVIARLAIAVTEPRGPHHFLKMTATAPMIMANPTK